MFAGSRNEICFAPSVKRKELFLVLKEDKYLKLCPSKCIDRLITHISNKFSFRETSRDAEKCLKIVIQNFVYKFISKWKSSRQIDNRFLKYNAEWLDKDIKLPSLYESQIDEQHSRLKGRPKKLFCEGSGRTKSRIVRPIILEESEQTLCYATEKSLYKHGKRAAAEVLKLAASATPRRLKRMKKVHESPLLPTYTTYTPEEALALMIDTDLGKEQYIQIQQEAKKRGANIYPPYNVIAEARTQCYPHNILVTDVEVNIPLQELLDFTLKRLTTVQAEVLERISNDVIQIDVFYKWGIDGSGGHNIYKQTFADERKFEDSNIILCTIVPLEISVMKENNKHIYWKNRSTSSIRYCRPVLFKLQKETPENMKKIYDEVETQIKKLEPANILIGGKEYFFNHKPICTMLDGKTINVLSETSSTQTCNICKVTPKDINDLKNIRSKPCNQMTYRFGISVLHAYLRTFEFLLHISYKSELQQWQARGKEARVKVKNNKNIITDRFYKEMGLVVDQPKQGGGNSNDGNTARKFFNEPDKVAEITGLDKNLIRRFSNILSTISSGHYIKIFEFKEYCWQTAILCVELYGWYKMSATVHKLLIHGADIIKSLPLPVGQLSEDVLEASHKFYKKTRLFHSRKTSRENTNTDIVHYMLISSDPIISAKRKAHAKLQKAFAPEVLDMIDIPYYLKD